MGVWIVNNFIISFEKWPSTNHQPSGNDDQHDQPTVLQEYSPIAPCLEDLHMRLGSISRSLKITPHLQVVEAIRALEFFHSKASPLQNAPNAAAIATTSCEIRRTLVKTKTAESQMFWHGNQIIFSKTATLVWSHIHQKAHQPIGTTTSYLPKMHQSSNKFLNGVSKNEVYPPQMAILLEPIRL